MGGDGRGEKVRTKAKQSSMVFWGEDVWWIYWRRSSPKVMLQEVFLKQGQVSGQQDQRGFYRNPKSRIRRFPPPSYLPPTSCPKQIYIHNNATPPSPAQNPRQHSFPNLPPTSPKPTFKNPLLNPPLYFSKTKNRSYSNAGNCETSGFLTEGYKSCTVVQFWIHKTENRHDRSERRM